MSDLGAIFHVKKDGTQYDAHAYTTEEECPSPNLKIKTKDGTQAYVKLTDNGSGDVPLRVKPKSSGTTYQVKTEAIPTGSVTNSWHTYITTFTVPNMIKVIKIKENKSGNTAYIGVTPTKSYGLLCIVNNGENGNSYYLLSWPSAYIWVRTRDSGAFSYTISWSSEINKQTPTVTDY